ncbi:MAG: glycoside hydrolase family 9 protein, partial [Alicyclobacillus sp.]|nr:glycoside hydrolase family 9 protein [Alicyclobacillus sp.]
YFRDRTSVFWGLLFTLILMSLIGVAFGRGESVTFTVGVVRGAGPLAGGLRRGLAEVPVLRVVDEADEASALAALRRGRRILVVVPPGPAVTGLGLRQMSRLIAAEADRVVRLAKANGYGVALGVQEYIWGSNMVVANRAMILLIAHHLTQHPTYLDAAADQIHYLLGRNTLDQCYVTGVGANPVHHPHHRPSVADGVDDPVPGLLAGGPNSRLQDTAAREQLSGKPPAACFVDDEDSYSTNEVAIYWNSPLVFALAGLSVDR